jgi:hypothetical protein
LEEEREAVERVLVHVLDAVELQHDEVEERNAQLKADLTNVWLFFDLFL